MGNIDPELWILVHGGPLEAVQQDAHPPGVLEILSHEEGWFIRAAVARKPSTPASVLLELAQDGNSSVCFSLVDNPAATAEVLDAVVGDPGRVRTTTENDLLRGVAAHPNTRPSLLAAISDSYSRHVREAVARNPNTPISVLEKLAEDEDDSVQAAAEDALRERQDA